MHMSPVVVWLALVNLQNKKTGYIKMILPQFGVDNLLSEKWTGFYAYHNLQGWLGGATVRGN